VKGGHRSQEAKWIGWILWWPTQLVLRHCELIVTSPSFADSTDLFLPLSPTLPLLTPIFTSVLRGVTMAEYLHQPYFDTKGMDDNAKWRWIEERKWAYRGMFLVVGATGKLTNSIWLFCESSRAHANYWLVFVHIQPDRRGYVVCSSYILALVKILTFYRAFDLEKRQHLFAKGIFPPLLPHQTGFYGSGIVTDLGVDIQKAEDEIDAEFSAKPSARDL